MRSRWTGPEALAPSNCRMRLVTQASATMTVFSATASIPVFGPTSNFSTGAMISTASFMTTGVSAEPTAWKVHTTGLSRASVQRTS
jgi:hypothetical protein